MTDILTDEQRAEQMGDATRGKLRSYVQRIERLEDEKSELLEDIKEIYGEAKAMGFDVKILRKLVALRKVDRAERQEQEALLELYLDAVGDL